MLIESVLRGILIADADVSAVIVNRAYLMHLPRDPTFPAIVYQKISGVQDGLTGVAHPRIQFTCIAKTPVAAKELANKVKDALHGHRGVHGNIQISYIEYVGMTDDYDEEAGIYWVPVDFFVTFKET